MNRVGVRLSHAKLRNLLRLDPQTSITNVSFDAADGSVRIFLHGATLPAVRTPEDAVLCFHPLAIIQEHQLRLEAHRAEEQAKADWGIY